MKNRVLFVDDEPKVLAGLQRMLRGLRHDWDMAFFEGGRQALDDLARTPADVVVTDMRMPGMDGSQLLREVMRRHPSTVRIVLSGQCDRQSVLKAVGPTHQFLTKPCDSDVIKATVARACNLRDHVTDERIRRAVTCVQALVSPSRAWHDFVEQLQSPAPAIEPLGTVIGGDVAMTAKVLQLVNSGFFGTPQRVVDPLHAIRLLGLDTLRDLALSTESFDSCGVDPALEQCLNECLEHARAVASAAGRIAELETADARAVQEARLAGLLHDVGALALAVDGPDRYHNALSLARQEGLTLREAERRTFGTTRDHVGAYLLALWGLPDEIVSAIGHHLDPRAAPPGRFGPLAAVHAANAIVEAEEAPPRGSPEPLDLEYLDGIGCAGQLDAWREACRQAQPEGVSP